MKKKKILKTVEQRVAALRSQATRLKKRLVKAEGVASKALRKGIKRAQRKARRIGKAIAS